MPTHEIAMLDDAGNRRRFGVHEDGTFHVPIDAALLFLISTAGATVFELVRE